MAPVWKPEFTQHDVQVLEEKPLYQGFCPVVRYSLKHRLFEGGWSREIYRERVNRPEAIAVLLYDPQQDLVVLIEQIRTGVLQTSESPWLLEIVAGMVEEGEIPEVCAIREVKEEAGYEVQTLTPICCYWTSPGFTNEKITIYCGLIKANKSGGIFGLPHDGEDIKVRVLEFQAAFSLLKEGKIASSPTVIALQWLALNRETLLNTELR